MRDIILDFETLDTKDSAIVPSIGATVCNLETGEYGERFHVKLDVQEQIDAGFTFSADTLAFWMKQQEAGRNYLIEILDKKTVTVSRKQGFDMLYRFIRNVPNAFVWGNGATFDLGICIREYGQKNLPWQFWGEQDVRSIVSFCKRVFGVEFKRDTKFEGVQHNPVDDANHEAAYLMRYFEHGRNIAQSHATLSNQLTDAQFRIAELEAQIAALSTAPKVVSLGDTDELPEAALTDTLSKAEPFKFEVFAGETLSRTVTALDGTYQSAVLSEGTKEDGYLMAYFFFNHPNDNDLLEDFITWSDHLAGISSTPEEADVVFTDIKCLSAARLRLSQNITNAVLITVDDDEPETTATHLPQGCTESSLWNEWRDFFRAAEAVAPVEADTDMKDEAGARGGYAVFFVGKPPRSRKGVKSLRHAYLDFSEHVDRITDVSEEADTIIVFGAEPFDFYDKDTQAVVQVDLPRDRLELDQPGTPTGLRLLAVGIYDEWHNFISDYYS